MKSKSKRKFFIRSADQPHLVRDGKTHMKADGKGFLARQLHKSGCYVYTLFSMAVRKLIVVLIAWNLFPDTAFILNVAKSRFITIDFTDIVQQGDDCKRFRRAAKPVNRGNLRPIHIIGQTVVHVQRMTEQPALKGSVKPCTCGRSEEIALRGLQIFQQAIGALPLYVGFIKVLKTVFIIHGI